MKPQQQKPHRLSGAKRRGLLISAQAEHLKKQEAQMARLTLRIQNLENLIERTFSTLALCSAVETELCKGIK